MLRGHAREWLLLLLAAALLLGATHGDREAGFQSDDGAYLVLAEAYTVPTAERLPVHDDAIRDSHFPPGWPMVLGLLGAGPDRLAHAGRVTLLMLLLALLAVYAWTRAETASRPAALAVAAALALMPATLMFVQVVFSEFLFMALVFGCFAVLAVAERGGRHRDSAWLLAAALVALASLTRAVGLVLILAFLVNLVFRRPPRWGLVAVAAALPWLAWTLAHAAIVGKTGYFGDGGRGLSAWLEGGMAHALAVLPELARFWVEDLAGPDARGLPTSWAAPLVGLLWLASLPVWWQRFRAGRCDAWYLTGSLGLILIWPYTGADYVPRFVYPLLPLQFVYLAIAAGGRRPLQLAFTVLAAATLLPAALPMLVRAWTPVPAELAGYQRNPNYLAVPDRNKALTYTRFYRDVSVALRELAGDVPVSHCVHAPQTALVMLHMRRIARPTPRPALIESLRDAPYRLSDAGGCRWVLTIASSTPAVPAMYPSGPLSAMDAYRVRSFPSSDPADPQPVLALFREEPRRR